MLFPADVGWERRNRSSERESKEAKARNMMFFSSPQSGKRVSRGEKEQEQECTNIKMTSTTEENEEKFGVGECRSERAHIMNL
jgi:hypothetical protein